MMRRSARDRVRTTGMASGGTHAKTACQVRQLPFNAAVHSATPTVLMVPQRANGIDRARRRALTCISDARTRLQCTRMRSQASFASYAAQFEHQPDHRANYTYRPCGAGDFGPLRDAHSQLLPVDYQDTFFLDVTEARQPYFSFCAVPHRSQLAGFATARILPLSQAHHNDLQCLRQLLGPLARNATRMAYVMTLGVLPHHQRRGLASTMLHMLIEVRSGLSALLASTPSPMFILEHPLTCARTGPQNLRPRVLSRAAWKRSD